MMISAVNMVNSAAEIAYLIGKYMYHSTVNVVKFSTFCFFCSQIKFWLSGLEVTKCLCE